MRSLDVVGIAPGVTYRQLDYWITGGLVQASTPAIGSGFPRDIPDSEVEVVRIMAELTREGIAPTKAAAIARSVIADGSATLGDFILVRAS